MADKWGRGSSTNRGAVQQSLPIGPPARQPDAWTALPPWTGRVARGLADRLSAERDRWLLWLPVFLGLRVAALFSLPGEPPSRRSSWSPRRCSAPAAPTGQGRLCPE